MTSAYGLSRVDVSSPNDCTWLKVAGSWDVTLEPNGLAFAVEETLGSRGVQGKLDAPGDLYHTWFVFARLRQAH